MRQIVLLLTTLAFLHSDEIKLSKSFEECLEASGGATAITVACINTEYRRLDRLLNTYYKKLMALLPKHKRKELRDVERAWIAYKEKKCAFEVGLTGGSIDTIFAAECSLQETRKRANELKSLYESLKGFEPMND